jgi:glycerol-3-phosphate dehydrogenase
MPQQISDSTKLGSFEMLKWIASTLSVVLLVGAAHAATPQEAATQLVGSKLRAWAQNPIVVDAIKAQNEKHKSLTAADIDKLDKQWRAETKASAKPLIDATMGNALSAYLKKVKADGQGLYTEIFVMDNKGLNVGQSDVTSDYMQGDEAKWQKTFQVGPDAIFADKVEFDDSSQAYEEQVSFSITDPATKAVIGAITVGLNADKLPK